MSPTAPTPVPPAITAEQLPDDVATLKRMILELLISMQEQQRDREALQHRLQQLLRRLYGPRSERIDASQLLLFEEPVAGQDPPVAAPTAAAEATKPKRRCRPHGRRRLPDNLPHQSKHHELSEAERLCAGCGQLRVDIGADKSEQLEYRPASLLVIEHFVHKYVCPRCSKPAAASTGPEPMQESAALPVAEPELPPTPPTAATPSGEIMDTKAEQVYPSQRPTDQGAALQPTTPACGLGDPGAVVIAASKPAQPIAKGLPGPGLLAHLIVSKYVDHLPLHRLERVYERQGLFLPRSTLCDWMAACAQVLRPLYARMVALVLHARALHTDDTPVKMQLPVTHQLSTARLWAYLSDAPSPYHVFDFTLTRQRDGPRQFLATYQGYLHADAFSGYDRLYLPDPRTATARIVEVACNAHARRKFYEARSSDSLGAHRALAYYGQLYELERQAKDFTDSQRLQMRQDLSLPILNQFHEWLEAQLPQVLPKSPMREAIGYALNNWTALVRYTEAGFLTIDNNVAEREMKRIAIGRKNWLFVGSPQGGQTAAVLLSFASTCQRLGVEPWAYLQDVLTRLPTLPAGQLDELLPDRWKAARATTVVSSAAATSTDSNAQPTP